MSGIVAYPQISLGSFPSLVTTLCTLTVPSPVQQEVLLSKEFEYDREELKLLTSNKQSRFQIYCCKCIEVVSGIMQPLLRVHEPFLDTKLVEGFNFKFVSLSLIQTFLQAET